MVAQMSRKTYHVDAYQDGKWWSLQVQEMPNAMSQVKSLDQAALAEAREFAAELDQFQQRMARMSRSVVHDLSKLNIKGKDIAAILKVSPQRVSQLLKGHK